MRAAILFTLLAAPALAQEPNPYADAVAAFTLPGQVAGEPRSYVDDGVVAALLPSLAGRWLRNAAALAPESEGPSPGLVAQACERVGVTLAPTTARSFELAVPVGRPEDGTYAERYDYVIGNTFLRSFDEVGALRRLFPGTADDEANADIRANFLATAPRGEVMLFHPSADVLVILQPGQPADIWLRCP